MYADTPRNPVAQVNREIPKEVLFRLSNDESSDARQDPIKKNRYWFKFPEEWSNRQLKDKVLGFRCAYLLEDWFDIQFLFSIKCGPIESQVDMTLPIPNLFGFFINNCFVGRKQALRDVCAYFNQLIREYMDTYEIKSRFDLPYLTMSMKEDYCRYKYVPISDGVSKCYIQWNPLEGYKDGVYVSSQYNFSRPNADAIRFFGEDIFRKPGTEEEWHTSIQTEIWDRKALYILSSIATSSDKRSYLGHTRTVDYNPIKYYRLDSDDKEFWVDLYSTRDHTVAVNDLTRWSEFHIEAIFMFSTGAML